MLLKPVALLCACFHLLQTVHAGLLYGRAYAPENVGAYTLPKLDPDTLPAHCTNFTRVCELEADGQYEAAFAEYEERYPVCGDVGWTVDGHDQGSVYSVTFKTTPCGRRVAVKGLHTPKECVALKLLTTDASALQCPGCFPQYYYYSHMSKACYSEFVLFNHYWRQLLGSIGQSTLHSSQIKDVFMQGVAAIRVLRSHNIEHHDLGTRNIGLTNITHATGTSTPRMEREGEVTSRNHTGNVRLVMFDLAGSMPLDSLHRRAAEADSRSVKSSARHLRKSRQRSLGANGSHPDLYMLAHTFLQQMYGTMEVPLPQDVTTFRHAFMTIRAANVNRTQVPDYTEIGRLIVQAERR